MRRNQNHNQNQNRPPLATLYVRGWTQSAVSSNPDGGISSTLSWVEKKSARKIIKHHRDNDTLVISVKPEEANRFTHINGYTFAGSTISISQDNNAQVPTGPRNQANNNHNQIQSQNNNQNQNHLNQNQSNRGNNQTGRGGNRGGNKGVHQRNDRNDAMQFDNNGETEGVTEIENALVSVVRRCYHAGNKFLNLQKLPEAVEFQATGLVAQPAAKVFAAIFVCCETKVFETPLKRQQMVESLSLRENGLTTVKDCISAAGTFNTIKNLDLGFNNISDVGELRYWRNRWPNLEHLILEGNPVDQNPETMKKMMQWYPKLKMYNNKPIAAEQQAQALVPPVQTTAQIEILPNDPHPELPVGSTYGQPAAGKPGDKVMKEQMALRLSYETRLKLQPAEECLVMNQFNYEAALKDLQNLFNQGKIQDGLLWTPQPQPQQ